MALTKNTLDPTGSGSKGTRNVGVYETTDTKATVKGAGYFNLAWNELTRVAILWIIASDETFPCKVAVTGVGAASVVTLTVMGVYT